MKTIVSKVSDTGKSILVGVKKSSMSIGYDKFAWCANPNEQYKKGDILPDELAQEFKTATTVASTNEKNEPIFHEDGSPVLRWIFN